MRPLSGFRIIDMTDERGALCGRVLADLGADVIFVEPPSGSPFRQAPPQAPDGQASLAFAYRNAGKRGVALGITTTAKAQACIPCIAAPTAGCVSSSSA